LIGFLGRVNQALGGTEERLVGYYVAQSMTEQSFTNKVAGSSPAMVTVKGWEYLDRAKAFTGGFSKLLVMVFSVWYQQQQRGVRCLR